jgi:hypothetical protein
MFLLNYEILEEREEFFLPFESLRAMLSSFLLALRLHSDN